MTQTKRPMWRTRDRRCDNCGTGLLRHIDQRYCPELTSQQLAEHLRKNIVGHSIDVTCIVGEKVISFGPILIIGVTEQSDGTVWADDVQGTSTRITQDGLALHVNWEISEGDIQSFRDCHAKGYYRDLPINDRLQHILSGETVDPTARFVS